MEDEGIPRLPRTSCKELCKGQMDTTSQRVAVTFQGSDDDGGDDDDGHDDGGDDGGDDGDEDGGDDGDDDDP